MDELEFRTLLARGYESRGVEFKGPGARSDSVLLAKVARAAMGMANRRDGGFVIIGVDDINRTLVPTGLTADQLRTWQYDDLAPAIAPFTDPTLQFDFEVLVSEHKSFVVLTVHEFAELPVLCAKDYQVRIEPRPRDPNARRTVEISRRGACYVRSRHKPETSEIPSQEEMRELLDLAIVKGLKRYIEMTHRAGLSITATHVAPSTDAESFARQVRQFLP